MNIVIIKDQLIKVSKKLSKSGGKMTTNNGTAFEKLTNNENNLIYNGYVKNIMNNNKHGYYYSKTDEDLEILYFLQNGFKLYMKNTYNINIFRRPDEVYIVKYNDKTNVKILEKKVQFVNGSVETKLWSAYMLKQEYQIFLGDDFSVHYGFCLNDFFKQKLESKDEKYKILKQMFNEYDISVLYGEDDDYYNNLNEWINKK